MDKTAYKNMDKLESEHWWFVARRKIVSSIISRNANLSEDIKILEAGCGTGGNLEFLQEFGQTFAFEYDDAAREVAILKSGLAVKSGYLPDGLHQIEGKYDLIVLLDVLEHVERDRESLLELSKLLDEGGVILITVPAFPSLWSYHDEFHHHKRRYTKSTLMQVCLPTNMEVRSIGYFNSLLFPIALMQRLVGKLVGSKKSYDAMPSAIVNKVLKSIFSYEARLLGIVNFPFGLSLYSVLEKTENR